MRPRLVVIAAHPDDETIGAAGLLLAHRAAVVHVTDGAPRDPALRAPDGPATREAYARLRRDEALAALAEARLGPADVLQLGLVDREAAAELPRLARALAGLLRALGPAIVVTHAVEGGTRTTTPPPSRRGAPARSWPATRTAPPRPIASGVTDPLLHRHVPCHARHESRGAWTTGSSS